MSLTAFLNAAPNLHAREELFTYKLLYDVKRSAAKAEYHLLTYYTDVDHDGFDIILDDRGSLRKIQLKTVAGYATTSWDIHKGILRPIRDNYEEMGFNLIPQDGPPGVEGGVVLMEYDVKDDNLIGVTYYYTDIYVINAIALGYWSKHSSTITAAHGVREGLRKGRLTEKLSIAKGLFIKAATPDHLLCLMGISGGVNAEWRMRVLTLSSEKWGPKGRVVNAVLEQYHGDIFDCMKTACGHDNS